MSDDSSPVTTTITDEIATIAIDDGKVNAMSHAVIDAVSDGLDRARDNATAVVIAGRPGKFSAGFDLSVMKDGVEGPRDLLRAGAELWLSIYLFPRPVVAACTGHALAAGAITLLAADTRIGATGDFKIGMNEVAIGMALPGIAAELARDRLSKRHFTAATNHAQIYDPEGALDAGFLDQLVPEDEVVATAHAHAARIAGSVNLDAFAATRETVRGARAASMTEALEADIAAFVVNN